MVQLYGRIHEVTITEKSFTTKRQLQTFYWCTNKCRGVKTILFWLKIFPFFNIASSYRTWWNFKERSFLRKDWKRNKKQKYMKCEISSWDTGQMGTRHDARHPWTMWQCLFLWHSLYPRMLTLIFFFKFCKHAQIQQWWIFYHASIFLFILTSETSQQFK